jgi:hypothetical protein
MLVAALVLLISSFDEPKPDKEGKFDPKQFSGVVVDDKAATKTGDWTATTDRKPFVGDGSLHDGGMNRGKLKVKYTPDLPTAGRYRVKLVFPPSRELSSKTRIVVYGAGGQTLTEINQRTPSGAGPAYLVGVFRFSAGKKGSVEISNAGADGVVVADAVIFEPVPTPSSR